MGFLLTSPVEYASTLCRALFKIHADHEEFLYLAKLLDLIQNGLVFTRHSNSINAPDYLSAALQAQADALVYRLRGKSTWVFGTPSICFKDLEHVLRLVGLDGKYPSYFRQACQGEKRLSPWLSKLSCRVCQDFRFRPCWDRDTTSETFCATDQAS